MCAAEDAPEQIATLRIELLDTEPLIWRQVDVPAIALKALRDRPGRQGAGPAPVGAKARPAAIRSADARR